MRTKSDCQKNAKIAPFHHRVCDLHALPSVSHVTVSVCDLGHAAAFYDAPLIPLGLVRRPVTLDGGPPSLCWDQPGADLPRFYAYVPFDGQPCSHGNGAMLAFLAPSIDAVEQAYAAALQHGATDEGMPGFRQRYGPGYFGAYLRDPDGKKLHIVYRPQA